MAKCEYPGCEKEEALPFRCKYCGKTFCSKHRLPERHNCEQLHLGVSPLSALKEVAFSDEEQSQPSHSETTEREAEREPKRETKRKRINLAEESDSSPFFATTPDGQVYSVKPTRAKSLEEFFLSTVGDSFTIGPEFIDVLVGLLALIVSFGFTAVVMSRLPWSFSGFFIAIVALSFLGNVYSQKLLAKKFGYISRFVLTKLGVLLTLILLFSPIKFLSPGILVIPESYLMSKKEIGLVGAIGPLFNILLSVIYIFLGWQLSNPLISLLFLNGAFFTSQIALINLIPFSSFPGKRIKKWNWLVLVVMIIFCVAILIGSILLGVFPTR